MKKIWPFVRRALTLLVLTMMFALTFVISRFLSTFIPIASSRLSSYCDARMNTLDNFAKSVANYALPLLSQATDTGFGIFVFTFVIVCTISFLLYRSLIKTRTTQFGAVTRDSDQQGISLQTPTSAPTTTDTLQALLLSALLRDSPKPPSVPFPTTSDALQGHRQQLQQMFHDMKDEIMDDIRRELSIFASTLSITLPSPTSIASMVIAANNATAKSTETPTSIQNWGLSLPPNVSLTSAETPFDDNTYLDNDSDDCNDSDHPDDVPMVQVAIQNTSKGTKRTQKTRFARVVEEIPQQVLDQPASKLNEEEMRLILAVKEAERKESERLLQQLTTAEKAMDLGALHRKWKLEDQQKKQTKLELNPFDFDSLGSLTAEEQNMSKRDVKSIIRERKNKKWIENMKARGVPLHFCEICQELGTDKHRCLVTRFGSGNADGRKSLVIKQTSSGAIKMSEKQLLDQNKLNEEFKKISEMKKQIDEKTKWIEDILKQPSTAMDAENDLPPSDTPAASTPSVHRDPSASPKRF